MYRFDGSTVLAIKTDMTYTVTQQTTHVLPPDGPQNALDESRKKPSAQQAARRVVGQACSLDVGKRMAHALDGGEAEKTGSGRPLA